jgi:hypothetical protein
MDTTKNKIEADIAKLANLLDSKIANWIEKYKKSVNIQTFAKEVLIELNTDFWGIAKEKRRQVEIKLLQMQLASINKKIAELERVSDEDEHSVL